MALLSDYLSLVTLSAEASCPVEVDCAWRVQMGPIWADVQVAKVQLLSKKTCYGQLHRSATNFLFVVHGFVCMLALLDLVEAMA